MPFIKQAKLKKGGCKSKVDGWSIYKDMGSIHISAIMAAKTGLKYYSKVLYYVDLNAELIAIKPCNADEIDGYKITKSETKRRLTIAARARQPYLELFGYQKNKTNGYEIKDDLIVLKK